MLTTTEKKTIYMQGKTWIFKSKYKKGILAKYASLVSLASKGAVTDLFE